MPGKAKSSTNPNSHLSKSALCEGNQLGSEFLPPPPNPPLLPRSHSSPFFSGEWGGGGVTTDVRAGALLEAGRESQGLGPRGGKGWVTRGGFGRWCTGRRCSPLTQLSLAAGRKSHHLLGPRLVLVLNKDALRASDRLCHCEHVTSLLQASSPHLGNLKQQQIAHMML